MKKRNRLEIKDAILEKLKSGGEYTYHQLRVFGVSTGLVSSIIHQHLSKQCNFRKEITGPEYWQQRTFISYKTSRPLLIAGVG